MKTYMLAATLVAAVVAGINPAHAGEPAEASSTNTNTAPTPFPADFRSSQVVNADATIP